MGEADNLRFQIETLERMAERVDARGGPADQRLLQAIATLITEKRRRLDSNERRSS